MLIFSLRVFLAEPVVNLDHLPKTTFAVVQHDHVRQKKRKRVFAHDVVRAPHRMAKAERLLLAREARRARRRQMKLKVEQLLLPVALPQHRFKLELPVEMVLDDALVAPGDENEVLDAASAGLVGHVLDDEAGRPRSAFLSAWLSWRGEIACRDPRRGRWPCE